ncbi:VOC family protein [Vogesella sp. LIG4]|uniref:VOC family protein n=1 Tax=Vogesella sp. LIG4 TaxID=1192162 RepID=UPI0012FE2634|nr:VOC family protein [Vogesella sp. LIG4]
MSPFVHWFEIPVTDFERAVAFYQQVFATTLRCRDFMGERNAVFTQADGSSQGCLLASPRLRPAAQGCRLYLDGGADVATLLARVPAAGGQVVLEKTALPEGLGHIGQFADPDGNIIGVHSAP